MKNLEETLKEKFGALIEAILGGILGIIFSYFFHDDVMVVAIFGIGSLISLSRSLLYGHFSMEFKAAFMPYQIKDNILDLLRNKLTTNFTISHFPQPDHFNIICKPTYCQ